MMLKTIALAAALAFTAQFAAAAEMAAKTMTTPLGEVLTTQQGMTLYTFDKDMAGKSACNGACADAWHPFMAPADATARDGWSVVVRDDGGKQWAYKGKPLYTWSKDQKPGDTTGEGFKDLWHAAKP